MNIVIFGPNGSGKGTQAYFLEKTFGLKHIEAGGIFRFNLTHNTPLGQEVKSYIEKGALVPDSVTTPMMLGALEELPEGKGWLLDGYPRNKSQAISLVQYIHNKGIHVDYIIELELERSIAKSRLLGRRTCSYDSSHSNNASIPAIAPTAQSTCRICNANLITRADDADENAIDTRHDIYYDKEQGTVAGLEYCKEVLCNDGDTGYIYINAIEDIDTVKKELLQKIQC